YSVQFAADMVLAMMPHVFPQYRKTAWRGLVTMKPLQGTISPAPELAGATSLRDVIVYSGQATYRAGVTYTFVIDMVPDYVFQGSLSGKFCIHEQKFST